MLLDTRCITVHYLSGVFVELDEEDSVEINHIHVSVTAVNLSFPARWPRLWIGFVASGLCSPE